MELLSKTITPHYRAVDFQLIAALHHLIRKLKESADVKKWCVAMRWNIIFDILAKISQSQSTFNTVIQTLELIIEDEAKLLTSWKQYEGCLHVLKICNERSHCSVKDKLTILKFYSIIVQKVAETEDWSKSSNSSWDHRSFLIEYLYPFCVSKHSRIRLEALSALRTIIIHPSINACTLAVVAQNDINVIVYILEGLLELKDKDITKSRINISTLLVKVFNLSLTSLMTLNHFHTVCCKVFNAIEKLHHQKDDPKYEDLNMHICQFVKNMVNIMEASNVFSIEHNPNFAEQLWTLTRTYVDPMVPEFCDTKNINNPAGIKNKNNETNVQQPPQPQQVSSTTSPRTSHTSSPRSNIIPKEEPSVAPSDNQSNNNDNNNNSIKPNFQDSSGQIVPNHLNRAYSLNQQQQQHQGDNINPENNNRSKSDSSIINRNQNERKTI
eukprot:UN29593